MTKHFFFRVAVLIAILSILAGSLRQRAAYAGQTPWLQKISPQVWAQSQTEEVEFLIVLQEQANLTEADQLPTKTEKGAYVYEALSSFAATHQKPVINTLKEMGVAYKSFWIVNLIWARGTAAHIQQLAQLNAVQQIAPNPHIQFSAPREAAPIAPAALNGIEWNIQKINAPQVWSLGYTGQGIVIGGQDTGYDWDHPALKNQYRGWDGLNAEHDYNWHDAIQSDNIYCDGNSAYPCDDHGHGTHTMGTMVGDDGGTNQIGVAPNARWIGCRNMDQGVGTPETYIECYQWFVAPTKIDGSLPDPAKAPDVINNSWGCPVTEGCVDLNILITATQNVRAAGILTVHSAGNAGSGCGTVNTPSAIYEASYSVGATQSNDAIAAFSSRGPVTVDGSNRLKPDISAPGVSVRSSDLGNSYSYKSGTSMAGPHVAGLAALLFSAQPNLIGQVTEVETLINQTAVLLYTTEGCGGDTAASLPNHTYGHGRIDAWAAIQAALKIIYFPLIQK